MDYSELKGKELLKLIRQGKVHSPVAGNKRLYLDFTCELNRSSSLFPNVSAYSPGCILKCYFCASLTRDFLDHKAMKFIPPDAYSDLETTVKFYSPEEAVNRMAEVSAQKYISRLGRYRSKNFDPSREVNVFMLMGCEPTWGLEHILGLLQAINRSRYTLFLETNGIILGSKPDYVKQLACYRDNLKVLLSIKAGTEAGFARMTGKPGRLLQYQYRCLTALLQHEIPTVVIYMCGPGFENEQEEEAILKRIKETGFRDWERLTKQDYFPFFVSEYRKSKKWDKGAIFV